jgi:hypothetical protein
VDRASTREIQRSQQDAGATADKATALGTGAKQVGRTLMGAWPLLAGFYLASQSDSICPMDHEQVAKGLRARLEKLEQTIVHADVKEHFLSFAKKNLDELERSWIQHGPKHIADVMLPLIEEQVPRAEVAVAKYGPTIRIIAG